MSGFQFPPPPPPPPRNFGNFGSQHNNQFGDSGRGRGRGRGRGGNDGRGRGNRGERGDCTGHRGGTHHFSPNNARPRNEFLPPQIGHGLPNPRLNAQTIAAIPPGSYVNPAFHFGPQTPSSSVVSPQRTAAGHKRKLDALRGPQPVVNPASPIAPSVPSFGAPVVTATGKHHVFPPAKRDATRQRTTNVLGLTPAGDPEYSASDSDREDEEVDEEAMFAELGSALTFEHNGTVLSLTSAADLATWKKERSKNFPTKARTAMKMEEKRQKGGERRRMLLDASTALRKARSAKHDAEKSKAESKIKDGVAQSKPETKLEKAKRELALQTERLEGLRKHVAKSEALAAKLKAQKAAREVSEAKSPEPFAEPHEAEGKVDDHLSEDRNVDENDAAASSSSSESSVISSDSSDSSDDDDEPPEKLTSKPPPEVPGSVKQLCSFYVASGRCRDGDACRFKHELPERGTGNAYREAQDKQQQQRHQPKRDPHAPPDLATIDRKSIFQRMMEQEHGDEDQLALQVIKHLGRVNFFAQQNGSNEL